MVKKNPIEKFWDRKEKLTRRPATTGKLCALNTQFQKMKAFFPQKKHFIFSNFSSVQSFLIFCQKNLILRAERPFLKNITIWYALYSKFTTFSDFKKFQDFFFEKPIYFFKKNPKFWTFWEILLFQSHFTANLLQFDEKNWHSDTWTTDVGSFSASSIGKHRVKKRTYLRGRFCFPYFQYGAKQ